MNQEKTVHAPNYDGPDRRNGGRRSGDFISSNIKLIASAIGIVLLIFTMGMAWATSKMALAGKVSREDFLDHANTEAAARVLIEQRAERLETTVIEDIAPTLRRLDERVAAIYCVGRPPGCR